MNRSAKGASVRCGVPDKNDSLNETFAQRVSAELVCANSGIHMLLAYVSGAQISLYYYRL